MYQGDYLAASTVVFNFNTASFSDGSPITLAGTPALSVYKNSTTESTTGVTLTVDYDARTGMHHVVIDTSADGTFYAAGNDFDVIITAGTVGGTSVVGRKVGSFSLENRTQKANVTKWNGTAVATPATAGIPDINVLNWANSAVVAGAIPAAAAGTASGLPLSSDLTSAAGVATAVWQDTTAGDFTVASSIGKSLYTSGAAPGAAGGLFIAGSNAATTVNITGNITGNLSGSVGSVTGAVGSVTGAVGSVTGNVGGSVASVTANVNAVLANAAHGGVAATFTFERMIGVSTTLNEPCVKFTGNGNGDGIHAIGGSGGDGIHGEGGISGGNGITGQAQNTNYYGIYGAGGSGIVGIGSNGSGLHVDGTVDDISLANSDAPTLKAAILTAGAITSTVAPNLDAAVSTRAIAGDAMTLTTAYDFAKGTVAVTESYNADGSAPTPVQALMLILQMLTEKSISSTTLTVKKLDGTTSAATFTLDSASAPTSITRAT